MNRPLTALFAALEAALVVGVGIGIPLVPLTVLWAVQFGFAVDWAAFWRASVDIWLIGHGADVSITLDSATATTLGLTGADTAFPVTIAALGFAVLTLVLAVRAGRRVSETRFRLVGELVAVGTFAALSLVVSLSAMNPFASPSVAQGVLLPTAIFAVGVIIGSLRTKRVEGDDNGSSIRDWIDDWRPDTRAAFAAALRGGTAAVAGILATAGVVLAISFAVGYARIVALYESLHTEILGGIALTLGQLAFVPDFVIWTASWLVGPGFAIGTGSSVSPLATQLGPVPAIPALGALPQGSLAFGFVGIAVPVIIGFFAAALVRPKLIEQLDVESRTRWLIGTGAGIGVVGGALLGLLAWFASGAAGPGRLVDVGPQPFAVAGWAALEIGVAAIAALLASGRMANATGEHEQ